MKTDKLNFQMNIPLPSSPPISPFSLKQKENINPVEEKNDKFTLQKKKATTGNGLDPNLSFNYNGNLSPILCTPPKNVKKVCPKVLGTDNLTTKVDGRTKVIKNKIGAHGNPKINVKKTNDNSYVNPSPLSLTPLKNTVDVKGKGDNTKI